MFECDKIQNIQRVSGLEHRHMVIVLDGDPDLDLVLKAIGTRNFVSVLKGGAKELFKELDKLPK